MVISIWRYRKFIWENAWRELWYRYAGSSIGFLWNIVNPLFQILLYTLVFSEIMQVRICNIPSVFGFAIYLCAGLIPWIGFSETVIRCTDSFVENANYLKKLAIPEQVFVARDAGSSFLSLVIGMTLLICISAVLGHYPAWSWLTLPAILLLLQGFGFGLGLILGLLNIFFRDTSQALGLFLQLWFWATPIVYTENILSARLQSLLVLNPVYPFIDALHTVIVDNGLPSGYEWTSMLCLAAGPPLLGYFVLKRLRAEIRDIL